MVADPSYRRAVGLGTSTNGNRHDTLGVSRRSAVLRLKASPTYDPITAWNLAAISWLMYDHGGDGSAIDGYFGALQRGLGSDEFHRLSSTRRDFALASLSWTFPELGYRPLPPGILRTHLGEVRRSGFANFINWHYGTQLAVMTCDDHTIIAFCGSEPPKGLYDLQEFLCDWWKTDSLFVFTEPHWALGTQFHAGFTDRINELVAHFDIQPLLDLKRADGTPRPIFLTGHSLGGALAAVLGSWIAANAATLPSAAQRLHIYTFGQPRVGDAEAARRFGAAFGSYHRVRYRDDLVSDLPPTGEQAKLWLKWAKGKSSLPWLPGEEDRLLASDLELYVHAGGLIHLQREMWIRSNDESPVRSDRLGLSVLSEATGDLASAYGKLAAIPFAKSPVVAATIPFAKSAVVAAKVAEATSLLFSSASLAESLLDHTRYMFGEPEVGELAGKASLLWHAKEEISNSVLGRNCPTLYALEKARWQSEWSRISEAQHTEDEKVGVSTVYRAIKVW